MADTKEKAQMKKEIEKMLAWYTFEAEGADTDVLENLAKLLESMEKEASEGTEVIGETKDADEGGNLDLQKAYARFWQYKADREAEEDLLGAVFGGRPHRTGDLEGASAGASYRESKRISLQGMKKQRRRKRLTIAGAAACFAAMFLLGVTTGAKANQDGGFFNWLSRDESGVTVITSPQNLDEGTSSIQAASYESVTEVPEKYREYVIDGAELESLREYEFQKVDIMENASFVKKVSFFSGAQEKEILVGAVMHPDEVSFKRQNFEDYTHIHNIESGQAVLEVFSESESTDTKYMIFFFDENTEYYVEGNEDLQFMERLAKEYAEYVIQEK